MVKFDRIRLDQYCKENEMLLVSFIKHYNIQKEDFSAAVLQLYEWTIEKGFDVYHEGAELPNPGIIYTFDNEIINAYYRRENPVVPEEYFSFASYEAFLSYEAHKKANP